MSNSLEKFDCPCERPPSVFRGLDLEVIEEIAPGVTLVRDRYEDMIHLCKCRQSELPVGYLPSRHERRWATTAEEIEMVRELFA